MSVLSDAIEAFLLREMERSGNEIQLKRGELAQMFGCAPSQINYVINTRFQRTHGYLVESKRGGGGYIIIRQIRRGEEGHSLLFSIIDNVGHSLTQREAYHVLRMLREAGEIDGTQQRIMNAALSDNSLAAVGVPEKDRLRAHLLKGMLLSLNADETD